MSFETLPLEIKMMILSHFSTDELLSIIVPVSINWKRLALHPILWKTLRFNGEDENNADTKITEDLNRCYLVKRVIFTSVSNFNFSSTLTNLNNLRAIKLTDCFFGFNDFSTFVDCTPNVESFHCHKSGLKLEINHRQYIYFTNIINLNMIRKVTEWKKLKSINLKNCQFDRTDDFKIEYNSYLLLIANQSSIEKLRVPNFTRIEQSFKTLVALRGPQLKVLDINADLFGTETYTWFKYCVNLRKLTMNEACCISKPEFIGLSKLRYLEELNAFRCDKCNSNKDGLFELDDNDDCCFRRLKKVYIFGMIDNWSMKVVKKHFPRLEKMAGLPVIDFLCECWK